MDESSDAHANANAHAAAADGQASSLASSLEDLRKKRALKRMTVRGGASGVGGGGGDAITASNTSDESVGSDSVSSLRSVSGEGIAGSVQEDAEDLDLEFSAGMSIKALKRRPVSIIPRRDATKLSRDKARQLLVDEKTLPSSEPPPPPPKMGMFGQLLIGVTNPISISTIKAGFPCHHHHPLLLEVSHHL